MNRIRLLLVLTLSTIYVGGVGPSQAACAPPTVEVARTNLSPGDELEITGHSWMSGCDDTREDGGCGSSDPSSPVEDIEISLKGPKTDQTREQLNVGDIGETELDVKLATVDAGSEGRFTTTVVIPDAPPGVYFLTASGDLPAYQPPEIIILDS